MALTPTREHPMFDFIKTQIAQNDNAWLVDFLNKQPAFNVAVLYDIYCDLSDGFVEVGQDACFTLQDHVWEAKQKQHVYPNIDSLFQLAVRNQEHDLVLRLLNHYPISNSCLQEGHRIFAMNGNETMTLTLFNHFESGKSDPVELTYIYKILYSAMRSYQHKLTVTVCKKLINHPAAKKFDHSAVIMNAAAFGMLDVAEDLLISHRKTNNTNYLREALGCAYKKSEKSLRIQSNFAYLALPLIDALPPFNDMQLQLLFPDIDDHVNALTPDMPEKDILHLICIQLQKNKGLTPLEMLPRVKKWLQPYYLRFVPA